MKKTLSALLTLLIIGGVTLAPISSVFAADKEASGKKGADEEPECD